MSIRGCKIQDCEQPFYARGLCRKHYQQWWYKQNLGKAQETSRKWKAANPERMRVLRRRWALANPEKIHEARREWAEANAGKVREGHRRYRQANQEKTREYRLANRGKQREYNRKYRFANREKLLKYNHDYRLAHPEEELERGRKWHQAHPQASQQYKARRRARKANTVSDLTPGEITAILSRGCFFAHLGDCEGPLCIAHDVPISREGNTTRGNVFCLCRRHNSMMHTKSLSQMLTQLEMV